MSLTTDHDAADERYGSASLVLIALAIGVGSAVNLGLSDTWFDDQRWLAVMVLGAAGLMLAARAQRGTLPQALLLLAAWFGGLSVLSSARPEAAAAEWAMLVAAVAVVALSPSIKSERPVRLMAWAAVAIAGAYSTGVLANYVAAMNFATPLGAETFLVGFANPRFPAQLEALTLPFLPLAWRSAPSRFWRGLVALVAAMWWMCLIGSGSRTAWIGLAAAAIVALTVPAGRRWVFWQLFAACAGAALLALLFIGVPAYLSLPVALEGDRFENFASVSARWTLAVTALDAARASPWLGLGPMHFAFLYNGLGAHPHNVWLQLLAEWGVPATAIVALLALGLWLRLWAITRVHAKRTQEVPVAVLCALTVWGVGSMADGYVVVPSSLLMSVIVLVLATGLVRGARESHEQVVSRSPLTMWGWRLVIVVACLILLRLPFTDFGDPITRERVWRSEHPGEWAWPRFWQQGWIGPDRDPSAR